MCAGHVSDARHVSHERRIPHPSHPQRSNAVFVCVVFMRLPSELYITGRLAARARICRPYVGLAQAASLYAVTTPLEVIVYRMYISIQPKGAMRTLSGNGIAKPWITWQ